MNHDTTSSLDKRTSKRRWIAAGIVAIAAIGTGLSFAGEGQMQLGHRARSQQLAMDPAAMEQHIDKFVAHLIADGNPEQKAAVANIMKAAMNDLRPMHTELRAAHARAHALLLAPTIDRAALEQLRAEQMQRMDVASKRILMAMEDAAALLSPEQRAKLNEKLKEQMH